MKQNQNSCYCDNQHLVIAEDVCDLCYGVVSPSTEPEMRHLDCLGSWMDGMMQGGAA